MFVYITNIINIMCKQKIVCFDMLFELIIKDFLIDFLYLGVGR